MSDKQGKYHHADIERYFDSVAQTWVSYSCNCNFISERELKFMFAICHRPSVCCLSVVCL